MLFVKNLLFTVVVPGTVAVYLPLLLLADSSPAGGLGRVVAFVLFAAGGAIYAWCLWDFATSGRGTPAPIDAPRKLVVRGLYRYSRNPMYVGVLGVILGWTVLYRSPTVAAYALLVAAAFHLVVVLYEERQLAERFGRQYEEYRARVGRWLPHPFGRRSS